MISSQWISLIDDTAGMDACWPTKGYINTDGYAYTYFRDLRRNASLARIALADTLGRPIEPGMHALHTCDNRACINPAHIYEGTPADNGRDRALRGRVRNVYLREPMTFAWTNDGPVVRSHLKGSPA